ncbi:MAG TPA: hypothetical protein VH352_25975 [Pseudonocardiaceae bacterium]|nr:hypothetical protein [Pseudonocardiaceae bacterium]
MNTDTVFETIVADLAPRGAIAGMMFGSRALKAGGKAFACVNNGVFAVKLGAGTPAHAAALALSGAALFDPSGANRPFKDWVAVPAAHAAIWGSLAESALRNLVGGFGG